VRNIRTAIVIAAAALVLAGCAASETPSSQRRTSDFTPSQTEPTEATEATEAAGGAGTSGDCAFQADGSGGQPVVGLPPDEGSVAATTLTLTTSAGPIAIQLDAERAPCTVQSMVFLAGKHFFDNTTCHRLTGSEGLKVLQCGDPEGTGGGGPGYVVPDEKPTGLEPAQPGSEETVIYKRGIVAMANGGPGTTGSQFFLVYGDSVLAPSYNLLGTMDEAGLATVDAIAAAGITPSDRGPEDGAPKNPVTITTATAA
jgi:peptidyl-prolyl cis-trans isomerase B (cyclophilin B)